MLRAVPVPVSVAFIARESRVRLPNQAFCIVHLSTNRNRFLIKIFRLLRICCKHLRGVLLLVSRLKNQRYEKHTYQQVTASHADSRWRDTLCSRLTHYYIVTSQLLFGKALPLSVFKHVKASYGQASNASLTISPFFISSPHRTTSLSTGGFVFHTHITSTKKLYRNPSIEFSF